MRYLVLTLLLTTFGTLASDKELILGKWLQMNTDKPGCPFGLYSYSENGKMSAAIILCSKEHVMAANYVSKWVIAEDGKLYSELINMDESIRPLLPTEMYKTTYEIISLDESKLILKDIASGEIFGHTKID